MGKAVSVVVTATVPGIGSALAKSAATAPVRAAPVVSQPPAAKHVLLVKKPAIKGSLEVGTKARVKVVATASGYLATSVLTERSPRITD